jgi:hypothetical protein
VTPLDVRPLADSVRAHAAMFRDPGSPQSIAVRGSSRAARLDGFTPGAFDRDGPSG